MGSQRPLVKVSQFFKDGEFCGYRRTIGGKAFYFGKATDRIRSSGICAFEMGQRKGTREVQNQKFRLQQP